MTIELWTLAIAMVTAITCSLCGVFLVVKREALISEGLSHAVLPGIIIAFIIVQDRNSPVLILSAAAMGLLMVFLVQAIRRTKLVEGDASLGIVFAAMFSIGIILASQKLRNTHFHAHCIIDGNLALAPLDTLVLGGIEWGPRSFYVMVTVLLVILVFLGLFFKELQLMLFDETLAKNFGFRPALLHILWLALVSITTVSAFETAGSILVVALMIAPPATAYLLTRRLGTMLLASGLIAIASSLIGFYVGLFLNVSPTGPMSSVAGFLFLFTLLFAPVHGLASKWRRQRCQQQILFQHMLLRRLAGKSPSTPPESSPQPIHSLASSLPWPQKQFETIVTACIGAGFATRTAETLSLTDQGWRALKNREESLMEAASTRHDAR